MRTTSLRRCRDRKRPAFVVAALTMLAALSAALPQAHAACDPLTDNCASLVTSVTDNSILYSEPDGFTFTFTNNACASGTCEAGTATALYGTVSNYDNGAFVYTLTGNDNTYSGPETITYRKGDGTAGTIRLFVCAAHPCTIVNPTAQLGTYAIVNQELRYTPDVGRIGTPVIDNLSYTGVDVENRSTTVSLTYVYPTYSAGIVLPPFVNAGPGDGPFRQVHRGSGYDRNYSAWYEGDPGANAGAGPGLVVNNGLDIETAGAEMPGIEARSIGGDGQAGGKYFYLFYGYGGDGGWGGRGGNVEVNNTGDIVTNGRDSHGILVQSQGGGGGRGGGRLRSGCRRRNRRSRRSGRSGSRKQLRKHHDAAGPFGRDPGGEPLRERRTRRIRVRMVHVGRGRLHRRFQR